MKLTTILSIGLVGILCFLMGTVSGQTQPVQQAPASANTMLATTPANTTTAATAAPAVPRRFVPVLLSVTDASGNPITGLAKEQLTLTDTNHVVQPLQLYKAADIPLHLGIVLLCTPASFSQQQAAAIDLVQKAIRPGIDEAFVVAASGKKPWPSARLDWKQDPAELAKIIQGLDPNAGLDDAFNYDLKADTVGAERSQTQYFGGNGVNVFDVIYTMMGSDPRPSRRVVVIFREPWAHSPGFGLRANTGVEAQLLRVIGAAQEMHISTFVIGLEDPRFNGITDNLIGKTYLPVHSGDPSGAGAAFDEAMEKARLRAYNAGRTNVQRIATDTGGATYWSAKKNYSDAVRAIANQLAGQYIVTFTPGDVPGPAHSLKVSGSSGARVLAQTAFFIQPAK